MVTATMCKMRFTSNIHLSLNRWRVIYNCFKRELKLISWTTPFIIVGQIFCKQMFNIWYLEICTKEFLNSRRNRHNLLPNTQCIFCNILLYNVKFYIKTIVIYKNLIKFTNTLLPYSCSIYLFDSLRTLITVWYKFHCKMQFHGKMQ